MELEDIIKVNNVIGVCFKAPFQSSKLVTLSFTFHHLILSSDDHNDMILVLHRNIDSIVRNAECGRLILKCKNLSILALQIPASSFNEVSDSIEKLAAIDQVSLCYPFKYKANFDIMEDGWSLFQTEDEFSKMLSTDTNKIEPLWRISYVNKTFAVCPSYSEVVVVPACITDLQLRLSAKFRQGGRFPVLSYRHTNGCVIMRSGQPLCGLQWSRNHSDERILAAVAINCGNRTCYVVDTRTVNATNAALKSHGGYECKQNYPRWKRLIQSIDFYYYLLDSYSKLMYGCTTPVCSTEKWISLLTVSSWLTHVKDILNSACLVAQCLHQEKTSVLVHGSEGKDVTLCISSLAQIIVNPDCRTLRGFEALITREWFYGGHPFWTRTSWGPFNDSGASKSKRSAPTFIIFLDCVWQIFRQFPLSFEFSSQFLVTLGDEAYASNFGTFLCDNEAERVHLDVARKTESFWSYVNRPEILKNYLNYAYDPNPEVIWPSVAPISMGIWSEMYLRWVLDQSILLRAEKKCVEIMERNRSVRAEVLKLRHELIQLKLEAQSMGLLK